MAIVEEVIIKFTGDNKALDQTVRKLKEAKKISKQQAKEFKEDTVSILEARKRREKSLKEEISDLKEIREASKRAFTVREIEQYNKRVKETETRIKTLRGETQKQTQSFTSMNSILRNLGATIVATFALRNIKQFTDEAIRLSNELQGVEAAFNKLNRPDLLAQLRKATRGTVTNLELMRKAVKADNFKVPLEKLAGFFEFATNRAIQTGKSIDSLTADIVRGIGRKSPKILDNLGISLVELQKEIKLTGDFSQGTANIINRELAKAGVVLDTGAIAAAKFDTAMENLQTTIGKALGPAAQALNEQVTILATGFDRLIQDQGFFGAILAVVTGNLRATTKAFNENTKAIDENDISLEELNRRQEEAALGLSEQQKAALALNKRLEESRQQYIDGIITLKEFIKINQELFDKYVAQNAVLKDNIELDRLRGKVIKDNEKAIKDAADAISFSAEQEKDIGEKLLDDQLERDIKEADQFDKSQRSIQAKKDKFDSEDKQRRLAALEVEQAIFAARADLALSFLNLSLSIGARSAEAQNALLAFQQLSTIAQITIDLQGEIAKNSLIFPGPSSIPFNTIAKLRAATGIATVLATTIPQFSGFKEGVIDLRGRGSETSDSIPAMLSRRESVMTAKETKAHKPLFTAIRKNKYDEFIAQNYTIPAIRKFVIENQSGSDFNDRNMVESMYRSRGVLKEIVKEIKNGNKHQLSTR